MATCSSASPASKKKSLMCRVKSPTCSQQSGGCTLEVSGSGDWDLPRTVHLPDGEELYGGRGWPMEGRTARSLPAPWTWPLRPDYGSCVLPPPNRTVEQEGAGAGDSASKKDSKSRVPDPSSPPTTFRNLARPASQSAKVQEDSPPVHKSST